MVKKIYLVQLTMDIHSISTKRFIFYHQLLSQNLPKWAYCSQFPADSQETVGAFCRAVWHKLMVKGVSVWSSKVLSLIHI